jgi:glycosyltransferase involved in cell wall biosynthesis
MSSASALICTRDRPNSIVVAVRSLLADRDFDFELIVVDQSEGTETEMALAPLACDQRLRYVRSKTRGKGAALNEGIRIARGDVLVCTDDDCEAPAGWVAAMSRVFDEEPSAAIAFCSVVARPYDPRTGYVPTYEQPRRLLRSLSDICAGRGLGAGMALRREVALDLGGFDESLGPGSRFLAAEDMDIAVRAVLRGWHVYDTGDRPVVHHGFRTMDQGRNHTRRDWTGLGAACAKPLRAGYWRAVILPIWELSIHAIWPVMASMLMLRRPGGLTRVVGFLRGFIDGLATPVDPHNLVFAKQPEE